MRGLVLLAAIGLCGLAACTSVMETPMPTAAVLTATPLSTPTALPYAGGPPGAGWALVFEDDFDGTALDAGKWRTCYAWASDEGCTNSSNEELQWYQKDDVIVSQGTLRLRALEEFLQFARLIHLAHDVRTADELAGAAELVKGNLSRVPAAVIRGLPWQPDEEATMQLIIRESERDLFR